MSLNQGDVLGVNGSSENLVCNEDATVAAEDGQTRSQMATGQISGQNQKRMATTALGDDDKRGLLACDVLAEQTHDDACMPPNRDVCMHANMDACTEQGSTISVRISKPDIDILSRNTHHHHDDNAIPLYFGAENHAGVDQAQSNFSRERLWDMAREPVCLEAWLKFLVDGVAPSIAPFAAAGYDSPRKVLMWAILLSNIAR
jgi:hypothetical protein